MAYGIGTRGGIASTRLYNIWLHMKGRCHRVSDDHYKWYGAKGVKVCDEWRGSFEAFRKWAIGNGYGEGLTIDRIDNEGDYSPENCRWVTHRDQCNNRRSNVMLTIDGVTRNVREWSDITGLKYGTIYRRYRDGKTGHDLIKEVV